MRVLLLLRGSPGCGKSTWIEKNGLKNYALSADDIRMMYSSPRLTLEGTYEISPDNDEAVWKTLFSILESRMKNGEFTVIDATNSKTSEMKRYKSMCETYHYRIYCVDFTDIPIEEAKRRNAGREELKRVPEAAIDKMYSRFETQKIPSGITVIRPNELDKIWMKPLDLSEYKKIHHIGDIHGCYSALMKYFDNEGGIKDDEFYIFCGDYIDRGIENAEVVNFLISIKDRTNVLMLEGNHERWLWLYAHDYQSQSKEFELITKPALDAAKVDKIEIRQLYRRFGQCAYYKYGQNQYLVTHGGLSTIPRNLTFIATSKMIKGAGKYADFEQNAAFFAKNTPKNAYQIHGHRNVKNLPIELNDRVFDLEGKVEFGGDLRCLQVDQYGHHAVYIHNDVFKQPEAIAKESVVSSPMADTILALRANKYIKEKSFGNISSFNFTRKAFHKEVWDEQTMKARGLFIDTLSGKVVARSYDKFFNINERPETKFEMLQYNLKFPVTAYVKENGFLGILSYNKYTDDLLFATKSTIEGEYVDWFKDMFIRTTSEKNRQRIKEFIRKEDVSFVFECVDIEHDPHVIQYSESKLYLLDVVQNQMQLKKRKYKELWYIADIFDLELKKKAYEILDWNDFVCWYYEVLDADYEYHGRKIEGFVIEDSTGFMTKLKLTYYNFWKFMRSIAEETLKFGYSKRTSALTTATANEFYGWLRGLRDSGNIDEVPRDICSLRNRFLKSKAENI